MDDGVDLRDVCFAGLVAAMVSGAPSTLHSLVSGRPVLEPSLAAGSLLLPRERRTGPLLLAALAVHTSLSLGWAFVLAHMLGRHSGAVSGGLAGAGIGLFDLLGVGRRFERIRALPLAPQLADHVVYGATVAFVLRKRRAIRRVSMGTGE